MIYGERHVLVFICIFLLLCAQFAFALAIDEPYPAIVFPAFGKAPTRSSHVDNKVAQKPVTLSYEVIASPLDGNTIEHGEHMLFGEMPAATRYRNVRRICPLSSDLQRESHSIQTHQHKTHYKLKMWLKYDLARGYYKPESEEVSAWLDTIKHAYSLKSVSVRWMHDGEVVHECVW